MTKLWIDLREYNPEYCIAAIESGVDGIILKDDQIGEIKPLTRIPLIANNGDLKLNRDVVEIIVSPLNSNSILTESKEKIVIVEPDSCGLLSLENLVVQTESNLFVKVRNIEETKKMLGVMEKGAQGIVYVPSSLADIRKIITLVHRKTERFNLKSATISEIQPVGLGDRVFVDTISMMNPNEGMLVGNTTQGYFLIHAESLENPYTGKRPFRVNAGAVCGYVYVPEDKTEYLSELHRGNSIYIINNEGIARKSVVGRCKIETRPLIRIEAQYQDKLISCILQDVATVHLIKEAGVPVSIPNLRKGDSVLFFLGNAEGRHYGMRVDETVTEV